MLKVSPTTLLDPITNRLRDTLSSANCIPLLSVSSSQIDKLFVPYIGLIVHKHLIGLVKLVGKIVTKSCHDMFTLLDFNDGSCLNNLKIICYRGCSTINPDIILPGNYFTFFGKIKINSDGNCGGLVAYKVLPVQDFNEISMHCCEIVRQSLELRKIKNQFCQTSNSVQNTIIGADLTANTSFNFTTNATVTATNIPSNNNNNSNEEMEEFTESFADDQQLNSIPIPSTSNSVAPSLPIPEDSKIPVYLSLNDLQVQIIEILNRSGDPEVGLSKQQICDHFTAYSLSEVQNALNFLEGEAHIFPTIDDHFRSVYDQE